jgi:hypothetical protein
MSNQTPSTVLIRRSPPLDATLPDVKTLASLAVLPNPTVKPYQIEMLKALSHEELAKGILV